MASDAALRIGQAFYGSFSGYHNYRVLAASPSSESGFSREEREIISLRSDLGGSAQTVARFAPIFTFYRLGKERRWAFSRTVWLGRGPRGNDYLAHVLALDAEVMEALRGDPFLLLRCARTTEEDPSKEIGPVFCEEKPADEGKLDPIYVSPRRVKELALLPCGTALDPRIESPIASGFLRAITCASLAVPLDDGDAARSLCASMVSLLPPEDRESLSFCSRFSLPRRTSFRLAVYASEDAALAERYLTGFDPVAAAGVADAFLEWVEACRRKEVDPLYKLFLFEDRNADGATRIVRKLLGHEQWLTDAELERLDEIVRDARNEALPSVRHQRVPVAWGRVFTKTKEILISPWSSLGPLKKACRDLWNDKFGEGFVQGKVRQVGSQDSRELEFVETLAILALTALVPKRPDLVLASMRGALRETKRLMPSEGAVAFLWRMALEARIVPELERTEAAELIQLVCAEWPEEIASWLEQEEPPHDVLVLIAEECLKGVAGSYVGAVGWPHLNADHWTLVASASERLIERIANQQTRDTVSGLLAARLLFSSVALASEIKASNAVSRLAGVLQAALEARVPGGADLLVMAASALASRGQNTPARMASAAGPGLRLQSREDFWLSGNGPGGIWGFCLLEEAWREVETAEWRGVSRS